MKAKRRQELKQDEFVDTLVWLWETFKKNQQQIVTGVVVALVLVAVGTYVVPRWRHANDQAWATLSSLDQTMMASRYGMGGKPGAVEAGEIEKYRKLAADYPRSTVAPIALYKAAQLLHETNKLDEALKILNELLSSYPKSEIAPAAEAAKASVLEDQGKYAEARGLYEKVGESGPKYLAPECWLNAGRCAELAKDNAEAKTLYEKAKSLAAGTPWEQLAQQRIDGLGGQKPASSPAPKPEKKG